MDQVMTHNINKDIIFYGVYSTTFDMWNGSDVLCSARKRFFETGEKQRKRSTVKLDDAAYNYSYTLESGAPLKYKRTKGAKQVEHVVEMPDGYAVELTDDLHRPVRRIFFNSRHLWLRTEYLNETDGSVALLIASAGDDERPAIILKAASKSEILIPFDVSLDKELTGRLNILTSEPKVFCVTSCGSFYFCTEDEYAERKNALDKLIAEQKSDNDDFSGSDTPFADSDFVVDTDVLETSSGGFDLRSSREIRIDEPVPLEEDMPEITAASSETDQEKEPESDHEIPAAAEPGTEAFAEEMEVNPEQEKSSVFVDGLMEENMPETEKTDAPVIAEDTEQSPESVEAIAAAEEISPETETVQESVTTETRTEELQGENKPETETIPVPAISETHAEDGQSVADPSAEPEEPIITGSKKAAAGYSSEEAAEPVEDAIFGTAEEISEESAVRGCAFAGECPFEAADKKCIESGDKKYYYFGELKDGMRSGRGRTVMSDGETAYEGDYLDDKRDGFGVYYYRSGRLCYAGNWKDNKREGLGAAFSPADGSVVVGRWSSDNSVEVASHFDSSGRLLFTGTVKGGRKNGAGMTYDPAGKTYFVGKFKDGVFLEQGTQFSAEGELLYTGGYKNNSRSGQGTSYTSDGAVKYKGGWFNNKYDGEGTLHLDDGSTIAGSFKNGRANGRGTLTDKTGRAVYTGNFVDDVYNGTGRLFLEDGGYVEGRFADGEPEGVFSEYDSESRLVYCGDWTNRRRNGKGIVYKNGEKLYEGELKDSIYEGQGKLYRNGSPVYTGGFSNGMRDGFGVEYRNGSPAYKGMWKNDCYNGFGVLYSNNEAKFVGSFSGGMMDGRINEIKDHAVVRKSLYKSGELTYTCEYSSNGELVYYGSISGNMRSGMGCTFLPNSEKQFEGIFRNNEPDKPMKVLFKELSELPQCTELNNTEYELYRRTPEYIIEKGITVDGTAGIYTGRLRNGVPDGSGTMLYSDHRYTGFFSDGKPEGEGIVYMRDGEEHKGFFSVRPFPDCKTMILSDITYFYKEIN